MANINTRPHQISSSSIYFYNFAKHRASVRNWSVHGYVQLDSPHGLQAIICPNYIYVYIYIYHTDRAGYCQRLYSRRHFQVHANWTKANNVTLINSSTISIILLSSSAQVCKRIIIESGNSIIII